MGRAPCCDKANVKRGTWSPEEDTRLKEYMDKYGTCGNWIALPQKAGLKRCGKSCRLRWLNYLRPNIKHGDFSVDEDRIICSIFASIGSRWSIIAAQLPGRTDNDIKNYWNTKLKKQLLGISQTQRKPKQQQQQQFLFQPSLQNIEPNSTSHSSSIHNPSSSLPTRHGEGFPFSTYVLDTPHPLPQDPMDQYKIDGSGSLLVLGGEQSCCSSDGSCNMGFYLFGGIDQVPLMEYNFEDMKELVDPNNGGCNTFLYPDDVEPSYSAGAANDGTRSNIPKGRSCTTTEFC